MSPAPVLLLVLAVLLLGCRTPVFPSEPEPPSIPVERWGQIDGIPVERFTLWNANGIAMRVTSYGATITGLHLPDREGRMADVVLGFDRLQGYLDGRSYFGCIVGRYANRIAGARFELDGGTYELVANDGRNHLHGGEVGFDKRVWEAEARHTASGPAVRFTRTSPNGEEGYPGSVRASVTYTLRHDDVLVVEMEATSTRPTVVNLAQHTYWNLAGHASGSIEDHRVRFHASRYLPVDGELIPTGELAPVEGTPFDFREPRAIGERLRAVGGEGELPAGYDHDLVIDREGAGPGEMRPVCEVVDPASGRRLELWSDQPGCQFYTGNFLDGSLTGKEGAVYAQYQGFCLETQLHPDSPNQSEGRPEWPSPALRPGETYRHRMEIRFGVELR